MFFRTLGRDYITMAFKAVEGADPLPKLYYNDYNIESPGPKARAVLDIVNLVRKAGGRIDGVGLQGHFVVGQTPPASELVSSLRAFVDAGVEVAYTELDIRHSQMPPTANTLQQQGTDYQTVVRACLEVLGCVGITVWDFYDQVSFPTPRQRFRHAALKFFS